MFSFLVLINFVQTLPTLSTVGAGVYSGGGLRTIALFTMSFYSKPCELCVTFITICCCVAIFLTTIQIFLEKIITIEDFVTKVTGFRTMLGTDMSIKITTFHKAAITCVTLIISSGLVHQNCRGDNFHYLWFICRICCLLQHLYIFSFVIIVYLEVRVILHKYSIHNSEISKFLLCLIFFFLKLFYSVLFLFAFFQY